MQYNGTDTIEIRSRKNVAVRKNLLSGVLDNSNKKIIALLAILTVACIVTFLFIDISPKSFAFSFPRRIRKLLGMVLTGGAISFSSVAFQTITNNRVLTPSVLGLDSLYTFIQTLIVFFLGSTSFVAANKNINFLVSLVLMVAFSGILYRLMFKRDGQNVYFLLLIGMIFGTFFSSLSSFMQLLIDPNEFLIVQNKMFASFSNINTELLTICMIVVALVIALSINDIKSLDVISLGKDNAINLGVDYHGMVKKYMLIVSVLVSVATALVGPITFLGILVVNLAKELMKTFRHEYWFITAFLLSVIAMVGGQLLVERVFSFNTSLSVIINFIGGSYFVYLLLKESKK